MSVTEFVPTLPDGDEYDLSDMVEAVPESPSRIPQVGDLVTWLVNTTYCPPFVIEEVTENGIVARNPANPREWKEESHTMLRCHDLDWYFWHSVPAHWQDETVEIQHGEWVFADDPRVVYASELDVQLSAVRRRYVGFMGQPVREVRDESHIPKCTRCHAWPCRENDGCPAYTILAKGHFWNREAKRFETDAEAIRNHTISKTKQLELGVAA